MFCPVCGGKTSVHETRNKRFRRRMCERDHLFWTKEILLSKNYTMKPEPKEDEKSAKATIQKGMKLVESDPLANWMMSKG